MTKKWDNSLRENNTYHATFYRNTIHILWTDTQRLEIISKNRHIATNILLAIAIRISSTNDDNDRNLIEFTVDFACYFHGIFNCFHFSTQITKRSWRQQSKLSEHVQSTRRGDIFWWQTRESGWHRWLWFDSIRKCRLRTDPVLHILNQFIPWCGFRLIGISYTCT